MKYDEIVLRVAEILNQLNIPYIFTGALAVVYYGEPRTTHDIDLVIEISKNNIDPLFENFKKDFFIDRESINVAIAENSMFNAVHKDTGFKIDFWMIGDDSFYIQRFSRRIQAKILDKVIYLPTADDVIISKLIWFKMSDIDKHYFDALGVYRLQKNVLDKKYIDKWSRRKSVMSIWKKVQKESQ